jgi:hypothetical protein
MEQWLKAGVMEDGVLKPTEEGTPQGAVVSPIAANVYLHYVFDLWAKRWRHREARGNVIYVRYADDIVAGFEHEADARRFLRELRERLEEFALSLHSEKTRLIEFGRYAAERRAQRGLGKPETFNFLGFTHVCGRNRRGGFALLRLTCRERMRAKLRSIKEELRWRMHQSGAQQGEYLRQVVRGFLAYHAVPLNWLRLYAFRDHVIHLWRRTLRRRSQKDFTSWRRARRLAARWIPRVRIHHPWPEQRFRVKHPRWEPSAPIAPARICAGGLG